MLDNFVKVYFCRILSCQTTKASNQTKWTQKRKMRDFIVTHNNISECIWKNRNKLGLLPRVLSTEILSSTRWY